MSRYFGWTGYDVSSINHGVFAQPHQTYASQEAEEKGLIPKHYGSQGSSSQAASSGRGCYSSYEPPKREEIVARIEGKAQRAAEAMAAVQEALKTLLKVTSDGAVDIFEYREARAALRVLDDDGDQFDKGAYRAQSFFAGTFYSAEDASELQNGWPADSTTDTPWKAICDAQSTNPRDRWNARSIGLAQQNLQDFQVAIGAEREAKVLEAESARRLEDGDELSVRASKLSKRIDELTASLSLTIRTRGEIEDAAERGLLCDFRQSKLEQKLGAWEEPPLVSELRKIKPTQRTSYISTVAVLSDAPAASAQERANLKAFDAICGWFEARRSVQRKALLDALEEVRSLTQEILERPSLTPPS